MRRHFRELYISQPYIAVFASGHSVEQLSERDIARIRERSFMITMNYAPVKLRGHLNKWSDFGVTTWINERYQNRPKDHLFLARERALRRGNTELVPKVDYWFNERKERLGGHLTLVWLLQLLERHFADKTVLLFGLDLQYYSADRAKWYDDYTDHDKHYRKRLDWEFTHRQCAHQMDQFVKRPGQFRNCNPDSAYHRFAKVNWKEVLA
ncbi:MAG: hypothetical protein AAGB22_05900 [Bacteroidota bacterium]